jgi:hypothetical protein
VKEKGSLLVATSNVVVLSTSALQNDKLHYAARRSTGDERMRHVATRRRTAAAASTAAATALLIEDQKRRGEVRRKGAYCKLVSPDAFRRANIDSATARAALQLSQRGNGAHPSVVFQARGLTCPVDFELLDR